MGERELEMLEGHEQRQAEQDERRAENQSNLATKGIHKRAVKALGENALKPTEFEMPKGVACKPGQVNVPEALAAWQW